MPIHLPLFKRPGLPVERQTLAPYIGGTGIPASAYSPEAQAYFAAMSVQPDAARKALINTYFVSLVSAGIWAGLDLLYLLAAHDSQAATLNAKNPGTFTLANVGGGPTFTMDRGFTGNGTTQALDTGYTPSTNGVNYTQDNASIWVWTTSTSLFDGASAGNNDSPGVFIIPGDSGQNFGGAINDGTSRTDSVAAASAFNGNARQSATVQRLYLDGITDINFVEASTGLPSKSQWICGANGASPEFTARPLALAAWGNNLNGLALSFYNATLAYMQGVGAA